MSRYVRALALGMAFLTACTGTTGSEEAEGTTTSVATVVSTETVPPTTLAVVEEDGAVPVMGETATTGGMGRWVGWVDENFVGNGTIEAVGFVAPTEVAAGGEVGILLYYNDLLLSVTKDSSANFASMLDILISGEREFKISRKLDEQVRFDGSYVTCVSYTVPSIAAPGTYEITLRVPGPVDSERVGYREWDDEQTLAFVVSEDGGAGSPECPDAPFPGFVDGDSGVAGGPDGPRLIGGPGTAVVEFTTPTMPTIDLDQAVPVDDD